MKGKSIEKHNRTVLRRCFMVVIILILLSVLLSLSACKQGPDYKKPDIKIPSKYRGPSLESLHKEGANLGDVFWWDLLQDRVLQELIRTAIVQNPDSRLAAERIVEARARLGIARSNQSPQITGSMDYEVGRSTRVGITPVLPRESTDFHQATVALGVNYEADVWGQYSRATEAARAQLMASGKARNVVLMTLISEVASSYFTLLELDRERKICKDTLKSREESYRLVSAREEGGLGTMLDVDQALGLLLSAKTSLTMVEMEIKQQENYLSLLLGNYPGDIPRGKSLSEQFTEEPLPPGLTSDLLINRPDIRQAEYNLIAANAQIGVARAAYFPRITLTASGGSISKELSDLFSEPSLAWSFQPQITIPIFTGGKIRSQVQVSESQQRQALISYEKTIQNAFREVSDSLTGYNKSREFRKEQQKLTDVLKDQSRLSNLRYVGGVTSYLEVLDTERQYFEAEIGLEKARLNEMLYVIKLYKALGGGWKMEGNYSDKGAENREKKDDKENNKDKEGKNIKEKEDSKEGKDDKMRNS